MIEGMKVNDDIFSALLDIYGTHSAVAQELGVGARYYRGIRNGTFAITTRMSAQMAMLLRLAQGRKTGTADGVEQSITRSGI